MTSPATVLDFWFTETPPAAWWAVDAAFDARVQARFGATHAAAIAGELFDWRQTSAGRLAEVIVLDQFSRNIFRGSPQAFASDPMALALAQEAVAGGHDQALGDQQKAFFYLPYMHSESLRIHEEALRLYTALGQPDSLHFEQRHQAIVARFGRYPHRNATLGRASSAEELAFLQEPGSSF